MATDTQETTGRIIIETETPGWYEDPVAGKKTRKKDGDRVMGAEEYRRMVRDSQDEAAVNGTAPANGDEAETQRQQTVRDAAAAAPVRLTSGKMATGETVTIQCAWVDPDKRTKAQQKLFDGPTREITYEKMVKAAGGDKDAMPCGEQRVIKKQDAFQVRFCPTDQKKHRNELRRKKGAAKRAAAKAGQK